MLIVDVIQVVYDQAGVEAIQFLLDDTQKMYTITIWHSH
jgi:hypothetical protein